MVATVTHTTPADGSFSATGATEWEREHTLVDVASISDVAAAQAASQPLDSDLTAIAALTTIAYGRSFLELVNAAAGRTALGLGTMSLQNANAVAITGGTVISPSIRERLTADRTYYVRTDGSDSNTGLIDSSGGAFLTIQKAVDIVSSLDLNNHDVIIQLANGNFTENVVLKNYVGSSLTLDSNWLLPTGPTILGDNTTPSNVTVTATAGTVFEGILLNVPWKIDGVKVTALPGYAGITSLYKTIYFGNVEFGDSVDAYHITGNVSPTGDYLISGGAIAHLLINGFCDVRYLANWNPFTVTITNTPNFTQAFVVADAGFIEAYEATYSGACTGSRYNSANNGVIQTYGNGEEYFPGNAAGTVSTGGIYA